jgi:NAD(P)-dependent dehydrogenase (short-subunit alcohol dehydrogenase family)
MMKILVVGASGTIGQSVVKELSSNHEIIPVGKTSGQFQVDIADESSVHDLFRQTGKVDAIVCVAGNAHFGLLQEMTADQFKIGLLDKLLGQVNLALVGQHHLNDGGSITLTSGSISHHPIVNGANVSAVNAAIDGFIRGAAIELARGMRINSVSPTVLKESWGVYGSYFSGIEPVPANRVALAYRKSVDGRQTGQTYRIW